MHLVLLFACADRAAQEEILELRQQVVELESQVTDLEQQLEQQQLDREERRRALRERMALMREERDAAPSRSSAPPTTLRQAMEDPDRAGRMGRFLLHRDKNGDFDGYRLSAVRGGTLLDALGLKNGDILHSVSGHRLDSMQAAMNAYTALEDAPEVEVLLSRRGQAMTLTVPVDTVPAGLATP